MTESVQNDKSHRCIAQFSSDNEDIVWTCTVPGCNYEAMLSGGIAGRKPVFKVIVKASDPLVTHIGGAGGVILNSLEVFNE